MTVSYTHLFIKHRKQHRQGGKADAEAGTESLKQPLHDGMLLLFPIHFYIIFLSFVFSEKLYSITAHPFKGRNLSLIHI